MSIPADAHVIAWTVLGAGIGFVAGGQRKEAQGLDAMELARATAPAETGMDDGQKDARIATLEGQVKAAEARRDAEVGAVRKEVQKLWAEFLQAPEGGA